MADNTSNKIYRKDYIKSIFCCPKISLEIKLNLDKTIVTNIMTITPNIARVKSNSKLLLNGENIDLVVLKINGEKFEQYILNKTALIIPNYKNLFDASFKIEIHTSCSPKANKALKGLYISNDIFVTQCEAEGFRNITYALDRPDIMSVYQVKLIAKKDTCPVLLSNGNLIKKEDLDSGFHSATWVDPFPKPSYLFALVAGKLSCNERKYKTLSGHKKLLQVWASEKNISKTDFCLQALVNAIEWDEQRFGLELDLERFMIVAIDDFNMGAMENKGLNIFNSSTILLDKKFSLDADFIFSERIVGHEYFHNWTGNRVTCRDWFQLTLKEGLTVFRDLQFSMDRLPTKSGKDVVRINFINSLRSSQFLEDAGPTAHPIRPNQYEAIDNFYTSTVYSKGSEVVRMIQTILGVDGFNKGLKLYFKRHDGHAVTCEDFVDAMGDANNLDFSQFKNWYSQVGTPKLEVTEQYSEDEKTYTLIFKQSNNHPKNTTKKALHIPILMKLFKLSKKTKAIKNSSMDEEFLINLKKRTEEFKFNGFDHKPTASINRNFSSPINIEFPPYQDQNYLINQLKYDDDAFNRWEASQRIYQILIIEDKELTDELVNILKNILLDEKLDPSFKSLLFSLPNHSFLSQKLEEYDPIHLLDKINKLKTSMAIRLKNEWELTFHKMKSKGLYSLEPEEISIRSLKNLSLNMLLWVDENTYKDLATNQYIKSDNMNDQWASLCSLYIKSKHTYQDLLNDFYERNKDEEISLDRWFSIQAIKYPHGDKKFVQKINSLKDHKSFNIENPNRAMSLIGSFCFANTYGFHSEDGSGYDFWAQNVIEIDSLNPQIASSLMRRGMDWKRLNKKYRAMFKKILYKIESTQNLSINSREMLKVILFD